MDTNKIGDKIKVLEDKIDALEGHKHNNMNDALFFIGVVATGALVLAIAAVNNPSLPPCEGKTEWVCTESVPAFDEAKFDSDCFYRKETDTFICQLEFFRIEVPASNFSVPMMFFTKEECLEWSLRCKS